MEEDEHFYRKIIEDAEGKGVTVNRERYRAMITDYLWPIFEDMDLDNIGFQQDGAPCHTSRETIDLLRGKFENRVISRFGDVHWPLRNGSVKDKCNTNHPASIEALKK